MKFINAKTLLTAVATLWSVSAMGSPDKPYIVTAAGLDPEMEGKSVYMSVYDTHKYVDSAVVKNGGFRLEGTLPESSFARLDMERNYANFIAGEGEVAIDFKTHKPASGNKVNMDFMRIMEENESGLKKYFTFIDSVRKSSLAEDEKMAVCRKHYEEYVAEQTEYLEAIVAANSENGLGEAMAREYAALIDNFPEKWQNFYAGLSPWLKEHRVIGEYGKIFDAAIATGEGRMFADVEGTTTDGSKALMSDYVGKGKYVLVDFWASWCGPCIAEATETLKPLYEKYGDRNDFMILGMATWDEDEKTLAAIEKHGLQWVHLMTPGNTAMEAYGTSGIPLIILFDPEGRVMKRNLRGEGLVREVEKAIGVSD